MNATHHSPTRTQVAERAYHYYLERLRLGLPSDEYEDWVRAEHELADTEESASSEPPNGSNGYLNGAAAHAAAPLTVIRGIGPRVAEQLAEAGIENASDLAGWTLSDFGEKLPRLASRAKSGSWIEQAREQTGIA